MNEDIKKLIRFLKEIGVYKVFIEETKHFKCVTIYDTMKYCDTGISDLLLYAFPFDKTIKGFDFWENINYRWRNYLKTNNIS